MEKHPLTFDQLPNYVYDLGRKVDQLLERLDRESPNKTPDDGTPLNVEQAAKFLGISKQTVYQNINKIPHKKRFGRLYFYSSGLRAYLDNGKGGVPI